MKYCINCKYYCNSFQFSGGYRPGNYHQCNHFSNIEIVLCAIEPHFIRKNNADKINKNNNCKYYQRKWYKFWVK